MPLSAMPAKNAGMSASWVQRPFRLFTGEPQAEHFARLASVFPVRVVGRSKNAFPLPRAKACCLPRTYRFDNTTREVAPFLADTETAGLLVARPDGVVHESYALGLNAGMPWPLWSVTKSVVALLAGTVVDDIQQPVTRHVPSLAGSGYDGVSIVRWDENYADAQSDIRRSQLSRLAGGSQDSFAASLPREHPPGQVFRYNTTDTHVLGQVVRALSGCSLAASLQARLWEPLGMQDDAFWIVDGEGVDWAGSGLMASLRDVARLGLLCLNDGHWDASALLPAAWLDTSTRASYPPPEGSALGYGQHWWTTPRGFCAIGIYNQFLYVDRVARVVVVKFSANRRYASSPVYGEAGYRHEEHQALFEAMAREAGC